MARQLMQIHRFEIQLELVVSKLHWLRNCHTALQTRSVLPSWGYSLLGFGLRFALSLFGSSSAIDCVAFSPFLAHLSLSKSSGQLDNGDGDWQGAWGGEDDDDDGKK
eukprot:s4253_g1.t1